MTMLAERQVRPLALPDRQWPDYPSSILPGRTLAPPAVGEVPLSRAARMSGWGQPGNLSTVTDMARMQAAIRAAERGNSTQLFTLYRDYIATFGHIETELGKRKMVVLSEPHTILPAQKGVVADQKAADAIAKMIDQCDDWERGLMHMQDSCFYPLAVTEKIFEPINDFSGEVKVRFRLKNLAKVDPILLSFIVPYVATGGQGNGIGPSAQIHFGGEPSPAIGNSENPAVVYNVDDWEAELRFWQTLSNGFIDYSWANVYRPDPERHMIHRGNFMVQPDNFGGPGRGCLFWALFSVQGRDWFAKFMEWYGQPIPTIKADLQNVDVLGEMQRMFDEARKLRAFFVNLNSEIEWSDVKTEQAAQAYTAFIGLCNDEISKIIVGQTLSSSVASTGLGGGVAKLQGEVRDDIRKFDHLMMGTTLRRWLFPQYLRYNGFAGQPPRIFWGGAREAEVKMLSQALNQLFQGGIEATDEALEELSFRLGFKLQRIAPERIQMKGPMGETATVDAPPAKKKEEPLSAPVTFNLHAAKASRRVKFKRNLAGGIEGAEIEEIN